jgi:hypothetical protein
MSKRMITPERELRDHSSLVQRVVNDGFVDENTIIVNVAPEYSSRLTQYAAHKLAYLADNNLIEVVNLNLPAKGMNQVWDAGDGQFRMFDNYLYDWVVNNYRKDTKYLFLTSSIFSGKHLRKLELLLNNKLKTWGELESNYRIGTTYVHTDAVVNPDFFVEEFEESVPLFFWENINLK